jgi:hypothetical protein
LYLSTTMALRKSVILVAVLLCVGCFAQFDDYPSGARRLPGSDLIGVGFDIQSAEVMLPVVDLTWRGREFDSPYDGNTYEIPYEVATISTPDLFRSNTSEVYTTVEQFTTSRARSTGVSLSLGNMFAFTATKETQQIRQTLDQKTHRFGIVEQSHIFFRLLLNPPFALSLSYDASEFLKSLPPYSQGTRDQWNDFFSFFGTHYVRSVDLGGRARMDILHDIKRWMKNDTDYVKTQFGIKFSLGTTPAIDFPWTEGPANDPTAGIPIGIPIPTSVRGSGGKKRDLQVQYDLRAKAEMEKSKRGLPISFSFYQVREELKNRLEIDLLENVKNTIKLQGGKPTQYAPEMWRDWVLTVPANPTMIEYQLAPISDLIKDANLQAQMAAAIADKLSTPRQ